MTPSDDERKMTIVAIVAGVLVLTAAFGGQWAHAFGRGGHGGSGGRLEMFIQRLERKLDLTDAHRTRVAAIVDRRHAHARERFLFDFPAHSSLL